MEDQGSGQRLLSGCGPAPQATELCRRVARRRRARERRVLVRELHDGLTHQLCTVLLQVMGRERSTDPDELQNALRAVTSSTDAALAELRMLVRVLRDDTGSRPSPTELEELSHRPAPTLTATRWTRALAEAGFSPTLAIAEQVDLLPMTVQRTLTRTLDLACGQLRRHGVAGTDCRLELTVGPRSTRLVVTGEFATEPESGPELLALRERVDLSGGWLTTSGDTSPGGWRQRRVVVTLPLS